MNNLKTELDYPPRERDDPDFTKHVRTALPLAILTGLICIPFILLIAMNADRIDSFMSTLIANIFYGTPTEQTAIYLSLITVAMLIFDFTRWLRRFKFWIGI